MCFYMHTTHIFKYVGPKHMLPCDFFRMKTSFVDFYRVHIKLPFRTEKKTIFATNVLSGTSIFSTYIITLYVSMHIPCME